MVRFTATWPSRRKVGFWFIDDSIRLYTILKPNWLQRRFAWIFLRWQWFDSDEQPGAEFMGILDK